MVKEGPCCHCGVTNTPLWRNGPPGKPVLCNACGSRWRTKGSLANYAPLHSRFPPPIDSYDHRTYREYKSPSNKKPKVLRIIKRAECAAEVGETVPGHYQCTIGSEDDVSNKSSSASEISFSSSCIQHGNVDGNDISGSAQSHLWDSQIPSRKRTGKKRQSPSPVEKLRRDLCDILQEQESSYPSGCSEELLFLEREEDPVVSIETGLGGFLIKQPIPSAEEESEASSLATETKISSSNDASMGSSSFDIHSRSYEINSSTACKHKMNGNVQEAEKVKDNLSKCHDLANMHSNSLLLNSLSVLQNIHSPQSPIDIQPLTDESFTWERETSSCSSHIFGVGMSLPTDRPLNQKCCQISEGSKGSPEAQNRGSIKFHPSQASLGTDVDFITGPMSGEPNDQMLIGCPNSSTMFSASFPDRNSTMLDSMKADPVETLDKDFFISSPSNVACFPEGFL